MAEEGEEFDPDLPVELPITDVLDLHAFLARDAKAVVEEYLFEARSRGIMALRIIHGRGIGVQRDMVRRILAKTPFVAAFRDAPLEAGGWGATLVTLKPPDQNLPE
jgi:DNA-nicking Smr family endonuclease